jgi:6-phosphogluconolactonase/glucosamine-6-phosphate isomerase/deaminase
MGDIALSQQLQAKVRKTQRKLGFKAPSRRSVRIEEASGMRVSVSSDLPHAADHAASIFEKRYQQWLKHDRFSAWGHYKQHHFTVAVGGGNTLKAQFQAIIDKLHTRVDWIEHVRFFFLEDSSGEGKWESPEDGLIDSFLAPLTRKLVVHRGLRNLAQQLDLGEGADEQDVLNEIAIRTINPMYMEEVGRALRGKNKAQATRLAQAEAKRYEQDVKHKLGENMSLHYILSGVGKDGALGALTPYLPQLAVTEPGVVVIKREKGAIRVALNRGVIANAETISLIVSGEHKLRALGRLEMEETADFEQTVMETPMRLLRTTPETAKNVLIFADEQSLHFEETLFQHTEKGETFINKAETRKGEEAHGPHVLLMHGFMGLFSFTSFLIRLPSSWTVSALHRGRHAKTLNDDEIFPYYARVLRKAILKLWNQGRPVPIAGHSIAGIIIDHLLLSLLDDVDAPIRPYKELKEQDKKLVDALRVGGIVSLATWAPSDGPHTGANIRSVVGHYRNKTDLDYSGFKQVYEHLGNELELSSDAAVSQGDALNRLGKFLNTPVAEPLINSFNNLMRQLLNSKTLQQGMLNINSPYILRLVGGRLLKTASFYGLFKEVNASLHDPVEYQRRHLRALDIMLEYDIPTLSIIHEDDFLVSSQRHTEEHAFLLENRLQKEGVERERDLSVATRLVKLKRDSEELPLDPLNPHLLVMATNNEGATMARQITAAMTRFVNENLEKAARKRKIKALPSVRKWRAKHPLHGQQKKTRQKKAG